MKLLLVFVAALCACAYARPGGYTANGGVFNPDKHLDYMDEARHAGGWVSETETGGREQKNRHKQGIVASPKG